MTPREYISWTQLTLWESSPERYLNSYLYNKKMGINRGMALGKQLATGLENDELQGEILTDLVMAQMPKLEVSEMELHVELNTGRGQEPIPLFAKIDTAKKDCNAFKEYKTGPKNWSKKQVDESGQITFYALCCYISSGKIPADIELVVAETTTLNDGSLQFTGNVYRRATKRSMAELINMMVRIKKAWAGIQAACEKELL